MHRWRPLGVGRLLTQGAVAVGLLLATTACTSNGPSGGLRGLDADGDGVRDDVAVAIRVLPLSPDMKGYLSDTARIEQRIMTLDTGAADAPDLAYAIAQDANRLITCVPATIDRGEARRYADQVQSLVENSDERHAQVAAFSALLDGKDFLAPSC